MNSTIATKRARLIRVQPTIWSNKNPFLVPQLAAKMCYTAEPPEYGVTLDDPIEKLWDSSHHTTFQHYYLSTVINGIAVGEVKNGLHLANVFYNTDERSGRYCNKMFLEYNPSRVERYIRTAWPSLVDAQVEDVMSYVTAGINVFNQYLEPATAVAAKWLAEERPGLARDPEELHKTARKVAQEQLRNFISMIFPTGLFYTINLTALAAMHMSAWTPGVEQVTEKLVAFMGQKAPELKEVFDRLPRREQGWATPLSGDFSPHVMHSPGLEILEIQGIEDYVPPRMEQMHPVDLLPFLPEMMPNAVGGITTQVTISSATMGQDQRHRTIARGTPAFTGGFYLAPILAELGLEGEAGNCILRWLEMTSHLPPTLVASIAPYGAMVTYKKRGSFNAIAHEQYKRLCWCAQEEIYNVGRLFREQITAMLSVDTPLLDIFQPNCYRTGVCAEGARQCGRIIATRKSGDYFPRRRV